MFLHPYFSKIDIWYLYPSSSSTKCDMNRIIKAIPFTYRHISLWISQILLAHSLLPWAFFIITTFVLKLYFFFVAFWMWIVCSWYIYTRASSCAGLVLKNFCMHISGNLEICSAEGCIACLTELWRMSNKEYMPCIRQSVMWDSCGTVYGGGGV